MISISTPRSVVGGVLALLTSQTAVAQTIQPLIAEYQSQARGRIEITNTSDGTLSVVLEPKGFTVDENGMVWDQTLPAQIHVNLSTMSFRIAPHQRRYVFYEATADRTPAWFVVYANLTGYPRPKFNGLTVQLELPHFVYLLPKAQWKADDVRVSGVDIERDQQKLVMIVENMGRQFGRIDSLQIRGGRKTVGAPGFPLFPGGRKRVEVDWDVDDVPAGIAVKAREFAFEQRLAIPKR